MAEFDLERLERFALKGDAAARRHLLREANRRNDPEVIRRVVDLVSILDRPLALRRVMKAQAERHIMPFCRQAWHVVEPAVELVENWHLDIMAEHLEAVSSGEIRKLLINMPPRYMKSLMVAVFWLAWEWTKKPHTRWIFGSYSAELATRDSMKTRRLLESAWYQSNWGRQVGGLASRDPWDGERPAHVTLAKDENRKTLFENTASGSRLATGIMSQGTGRGGDRIVCDDAHKVSDGGSPKKLERAATWWFEEMPTRGNTKDAAFVGVMQRIHQSDLSGRMLSKSQGDLVHLKLPCRYEAPTFTTGKERKEKPKKNGPAIKRVNVIVRFEDPRTIDGELLWPDRFDEAFVSSLETTMGSAAAAGQLQQRPSARGGSIWYRKWWNFWLKSELPKFDFKALSVDCTFGSKSDSASYVVFQEWGFDRANSYLLDQVRARMTYPQMRINLPVFSGSRRYDVCWIENKASGVQLSQDLLDVVPAMVLTDPKDHGNKLQRAIKVAPRIESGNVFLPRPDLFQWVDGFLDETELFPNAANNDQVDTASQALNHRADMEDQEELQFDFA